MRFQAIPATGAPVRTLCAGLELAADRTIYAAITRSFGEGSSRVSPGRRECRSSTSYFWRDMPRTTG
jgi:hypothetical protein